MWGGGMVRGGGGGRRAHYLRKGMNDMPSSMCRHGLVSMNKTKMCGWGGTKTGCHIEANIERQQL